MEWNELLDSLEQKARRLKQRTDRLEQENRELRDSVFRYLEQLDQKAKALREAEQKETATLLSQALPAGERKALRKEIDRYIALLDRCVAQLNAGLLGEAPQPFPKK